MTRRVALQPGSSRVWAALRRCALIVAATALGMVVVTLCLAASGRLGAEPAADMYQLGAKLSRAPERKTDLLLRAAVWKYAAGDTRGARDLAWQAWLAARESSVRVRLESDRAWVGFTLQADGPARAVEAFRYVFDQWPAARADAAMRARYLHALSLAGDDQAVEIEFEQFSASSEMMQSTHAVDAVIAANMAARRLRGAEAQKRFLRRVQDRWPGTAGARRANDLMKAP